MSKKKIKVFDFFSGCGGTAQGFKQAGLDVVVGIEHKTWIVFKWWY